MFAPQALRRAGHKRDKMSGSRPSWLFLSPIAVTVLARALGAGAAWCLTVAIVLALYPPAFAVLAAGGRVLLLDCGAKRGPLAPADANRRGAARSRMGALVNIQPFLIGDGWVEVLDGNDVGTRSRSGCRTPSASTASPIQDPEEVPLDARCNAQAL